MSVSKELNDYYEEVCKLRKAANDEKFQNVLSEKVGSVREIYENATCSINNTCHSLNEFSCEAFKGRTLTDTISIGKESAPLIVTLKELADNLYKADVNGSDVNIEEKLQNYLSKAEDNLHHIEDTLKSTNKFIHDLESLTKYFKNQNKLESLSTVSEVSSFLDKDVVASSPINQ